jgi:hypothetical protein
MDAGEIHTDGEGEVLMNSTHIDTKKEGGFFRLPAAWMSGASR